MNKFLLPLLVFPFLSSAQPSQILRDEAVSWAAVIEIVLPAEPLSATIKDGKEASVAVLKLSTDDQSLVGFINYSLNEKLWDAAQDGQWEAYADAALTHRLSVDELIEKATTLDTMRTYDPETYEEKIRVAYDAHPLPFEAPLLKVRELLTYDDEDAVFSVHPLAIGPYYDGVVPFWLRVPDPPSVSIDPNVSQPEVTWAVRYVTKDASPRPEEMQVVKDETGPIIEHFFDRLRLDTSIALYDANQEPITPQRRQCLFSCTDTVVTFDPETAIEHVQIIRSDLLPRDIVDLQLIQEWYWQEPGHLLTTRLVAVAPRQKFYYQEETWMARVGFYRFCEE